MKRYTLQLVIEEGSDEFWESIKGSGADEVVELVEDALFAVGFVGGENCRLKMIKFEDEPEEAITDG